MKGSQAEQAPQLAATRPQLAATRPQLAATRPQVDFTLYLVTDREMCAMPSFEEAVDAACEGGVTLVQLREKHASHDEIVERAERLKRVTDAHGVGLIINDDALAADQVGAAGVHVGQDDMSIAEARAIVGSDALVGVSASTLDEALRAEREGADYLGIGAMTFTPTKPDAHVTTLEELALILDAVEIPCVVIGGVNATSLPTYARMDKLAGYAVVSAIISVDDCAAAARCLRSLIDANMASKGV